MNEQPQSSAPPVGFRKAIPTKVKLQVVLRQGGICKSCGQRIEEVENCRFDHVPAIQLRAWDPIANDTTPSVNNPDFINALHEDCHAIKTTGRRGESRLSARDGDVAAIAKVRRLTRKQEAYRQRLLAKDDPDAEEPETKAKPKYRWPKRSFSSNRKKAEARPEEG
jgi:hypothetical protein